MVAECRFRVPYHEAQGADKIQLKYLGRTIVSLCQKMVLRQAGLLLSLVAFLLPVLATALLPAGKQRQGRSSSAMVHRRRLLVVPKAVDDAGPGNEGGGGDDSAIASDIEEATRKWGLEGGLFKSAQQGNFDQAKQLLKKYGAAYLATSISFAIVSFAICYKLVDSGVDVGALLAKVGIAADTGSAGETAGTAGIAYIVHKAASPIRTVPVVALTPVVAQWMGKEPVEEGSGDENERGEQ